jgi:hypothetical protein
MKKLLSMKTIILLLTFCCPVMICVAQYVGIGAPDPKNPLQVTGNFVVTQPVVKTQAAPTVAQAKTMVNNVIVNFADADSTGYIYDPGGPAGDYIANLVAGAAVPISAPCVGFELTIEDLQLGTGDSLFIKEYNGGVNVYAIGNGFNTASKLTVSSSQLYVLFISNSDGNNGRGFSLLFRRLYSTSSQEEVKGFTGRSLFFDTKTGAFRAGNIDHGARGTHSTGIGFLTKASGQYATALGHYTLASGDYATALGSNSYAYGNYSTVAGYNNSAPGIYAVAMGSNNFAGSNGAVAFGNNCRAESVQSFSAGNGNLASGSASTALGSSTDATGPNATALGAATTASGATSLDAGGSSIASGLLSVAIGTQVTASGNYSTALGSFVSTAGYTGAFIIGDNSTVNVLSASGPNSFRARFVGGYALFTGLGPSVGVVVNPGGNSWSAISDVRLIENFLPINGEDILTRISKLPLSTWNYIGQDRKTLRHYGPMAQDFYQAFGHDALGEIGCDTLINQQDFLGVNLIGIQALEKRTGIQQEQIAQLTRQVEVLSTQNARLMAVLEQVATKQKNKKRRVKD